MALSEISSVTNKSDIQNAKVVKDGSTVLVRVNKDLGNNRYEGVVGGVKINFSSKNPLTSGTSFVANITKIDGKIVLFPKNENSILNQTIQKSDFYSNLLSEIGINPNTTSLHILKQIKQLQMPFESLNIKKVFNQSIKQKGKEKKVADLLLLFQEKNILLNQDELINLLEFLDGDFSDSEGKDKINMLNSKSGAWFVFPYNLVEEKENLIIGKGCIKLFFDKLQTLKVVNLNCNFKKHNFFFNLIYNNKELAELSYYIDNVDEIVDVQTELEKLFPGISVTICDPDDMDLTDCENEELYSINGEV